MVALTDDCCRWVSPALLNSCLTLLHTQVLNGISMREGIEIQGNNLNHCQGQSLLQTHIDHLQNRIPDTHFLKGNLQFWRGEKRTFLPKKASGPSLNPKSNRTPAGVVLLHTATAHLLLGEHTLVQLSLMTAISQSPFKTLFASHCLHSHCYIVTIE